MYSGIDPVNPLLLCFGYCSFSKKSDLYHKKKIALQCVAVCCSVLQCVAVCCSVLQCVAANAESMKGPIKRNKTNK